ncbi:hypothetical protein ACFL0Z_02645 [Patescibacteria group bacterium]
MTKAEAYEFIDREYKKKTHDYTDLFSAVMKVGGIFGSDFAMQILSECVVAKKTTWLDKHLHRIRRSDDPFDDVIRILYQDYMGLRQKEDFVVAERTSDKLVIKCWNFCPVLEACQKLNLNTKDVCQKAYHEWVQVFVQRLDSGLYFARDYNKIRPHCNCCEEIYTKRG